MSTQATIAPVRKTITVEASQQRAFDVYTRGFDSWWPRSHHLGGQPLEKATIEPFAGGRCYERDTDGSECDWGRVLVWEPPARLVFSWAITPQWKPEPDPAKASEVEIRFIAEGPSRTRIELEHRGFERHGEGAETMRQGVGGEGGWTMLLDLFAKAVTARG